MFTHSAASGTEQPLRFAGRHAELYGMLHQPAVRRRGAILLCTADGEERAWCHRTYVLLARALARRGHTVLRFEYSGQGESAGAYEETTIDTRLDDIAAALAVLTFRSGESAPAVVGARLGGSLVLELMARDRRKNPVVLIEPVLDTAAHATHLLRVNLTMQMVIHKQVVRTREQLLEDLAGGAYVSANGYKLSAALIEGLQELKPVERLPALIGPTLIVTTPATRLPASSAEVVRQPFAPFWKEPKADMTPPKSVIDAASNWLDQQFPGEVQ